MEYDKIKAAMESFFDREEKSTAQQKLIDKEQQTFEQEAKKLKVNECARVEKNIPIIRAKIDGLIKEINASAFNNRGTITPWQENVDKRARSHREGGECVYQGEGYSSRIGGYEVSDGWFLTRKQETRLDVGRLFSLSIILDLGTVTTNTSGQVDSGREFYLMAIALGDLFFNKENKEMYKKNSVARGFYLDDPGELVAGFGKELREALSGLNEFQKPSSKI